MFPALLPTPFLLLKPLFVPHMYEDSLSPQRPQIIVPGEDELSTHSFKAQERYQEIKLVYIAVLHDNHDHKLLQVPKISHSIHDLAVDVCAAMICTCTYSNFLRPDSEARIFIQVRNIDEIGLKVRDTEAGLKVQLRALVNVLLALEEDLLVSEEQGRCVAADQLAIFELKVAIIGNASTGSAIDEWVDLVAEFCRQIEEGEWS